MPTTFRTPINGRPIMLALNAPNAEITTEAVPGLTEATARITGSSEVIDRATEARDGDRWTITLPEGAGTVTSFGRGTNVFSGGGVVVQAGNISGTVVFSDGDLHIGSGSATRAVVVEPTRVHVRLPEGSDLIVKTENGTARARGVYGHVDFNSHNGSLHLDRAVRVDAGTNNGSFTFGGASDEIDASTTNGSVDVHASAPITRVNTTNGSVFVSAAGAHRIDARTTNGDVTVLRNGHSDADIRTRTTNGRDRVR
ncbi:hypothetical protein ACFVWN_17800 [Nocardiopsis flavescens]|uniref:hypothetical protein n=1 Tax=Nocardiopsis flavescens TaxID=758803 RepID=UPI00365376A4